MNKSMHIVVSGAGSYLGGPVLRDLAARPDLRVTALASPRRTCPADLKGRLTWHQVDLEQPLPEEVRRTLRAADSLLHMAWVRGERDQEALLRNRRMLEQLFLDLPEPGRLIFISSVSSSPAARSVYGRTKEQIGRWVVEQGGVTLVLGLVVEADPMAGAYKMLRNLVRKMPVAFRTALGSVPVYPIRLSEMVRTLRAVTCAPPVAGLYQLFPEPLSFNQFMRHLEARYCRTRVPLPLPVPLVLGGAALMKNLHLGPAKLWDQVLTLFFKDPELLGRLLPIPGERLTPCQGADFFADFAPDSHAQSIL